MITACCGLCNVTYSSKVNVIVRAVRGTFTEESLGEDITNRGGKLSFGPPPGGMIFAQEESSAVIENPIAAIKKPLILCFMRVQI